MQPVQGAVTTDDGRALTTFSWGSGDDVVVLESGLGLSGRFWGPVARRLSSSVRAVAYDRAGLGASAPDPQPRTLDRLAGDLCSVIGGQRVSRLVLVGHSWGGPVVRRAAVDLSRGALQALVLVDPSDELAGLHHARAAGVLDDGESMFMPLFARTGLLRPALRFALRGELEPDELRATLSASASVAAARASAQENRHIRAGLFRLEARAREVDVPLSVVSGTRPPVVGSRARMVAAHERRAARSAGGRFVRASGSRHMIPLTEPGVIADEVLRRLG